MDNNTNQKTLHQQPEVNSFQAITITHNKVSYSY